MTTHTVHDFGSNAHAPVYKTIQPLKIWRAFESPVQNKSENTQICAKEQYLGSIIPKIKYMNIYPTKFAHIFIPV